MIPTTKHLPPDCFKHSPRDGRWHCHLGTARQWITEALCVLLCVIVLILLLLNQ